MGSEWKEFFYDALIPWYHYIPLPDASTTEGQNQGESIKDLLTFLQTDERKFGVKSGTFIAEQIASNGRHFIEHHLKMSDIQNYWRELLLIYSRLLEFQPILTKDFIIFELLMECRLLHVLFFLVLSFVIYY